MESAEARRVQDADGRWKGERDEKHLVLGEERRDKEKGRGRETTERRKKRERRGGGVGMEMSAISLFLFFFSHSLLAACVLSIINSR